MSQLFLFICVLVYIVNAIRTSGFGRPELRPRTLDAGPLGRIRCDEGDDFIRFVVVSNTWNRSGLRILVEPETEGHRQAMTRGLQDIEVGRGDFDHAFLVRSSDPRMALRVLDDRIQDWAVAMAHAANGGAVTLKLELLVCEVRKELPGGRLTPDERALLEGGARAWAQAAHAALTGVEAVHAGPPPGLVPDPPPPPSPDTSGVELGGVELAEGECQVCGEAVDEDPRCCDYCGLPHHRDCWEFHGGCTTYACPGGP